MATFRDALGVINSLKEQGLVEDYAIAGAMALAFWAEPVPPYDLDVLVFLPPSEGVLLSLEPPYRWTAAKGYPLQDEHVMIEGVPTQFKVSPNARSSRACVRMGG